MKLIERIIVGLLTYKNIRKKKWKSEDRISITVQFLFTLNEFV